MTDKTFVSNYLQNIVDLIPKLDTEKLSEAIAWMRTARDEGRTIFICGNGGSGSIAAEMATEIVKGASLGKATRFRMLSLCDSPSTITAYANDEGYETVFVEPLKNFAQKDDLLIVLSGSGNSPNVLRAVEYAHEAGCKTIGLTSANQGRLRELVQLPLLSPATHMGRLEDCFFIMTHILSYVFMEDPEGETDEN